MTRYLRCASLEVRHIHRGGVWARLMLSLSQGGNNKSFSRSGGKLGKREKKVGVLVISLLTVYSATWSLALALTISRWQNEDGFNHHRPRGKFGFVMISIKPWNIY